MATEKNFLDVIMEFCNLDPEHIEFAKSTLFKYKDNPVINHVCSVLKANATASNRFTELCSEANVDLWNNTPKVFPLIIPNPDNLTELRVFPNIILNSRSGLESANSSYCHDLLSNFIKAYEDDLTNAGRRERWEPLDRAKARISEYVDYPTARALTRYIFTADAVNDGKGKEGNIITGKLKDSQIRDFAEAIDNCRKPMEIKFAEKPADFIHMYGSGPTSCMGFSAGEQERWAFMIKQGYAPTSWYAFCEYTKGAYAEKNGKIIARTILFKQKDKWYWGRTYGINSEVQQKFINSLAEMGIVQGSTCKIEAGTKVVVPGIKATSGGFAAPFPYFDSPIPGGDNWRVSYDGKANQFSFYYGVREHDKIVARGGHVLSQDYVAIYCSTCKKKLNTREFNVLAVEGEHIFCSDPCAATEGYVRVMNGIGDSSYHRPSEDQVNTTSPFIKCSTIKAAMDLGYAPLMDEIGIIPEDTDIRFTPNGETISSLDGSRYRHSTEGFGVFSNGSRMKISTSKIPLKISKAMKVVEFREEAVLEIAN